MSNMLEQAIVDARTLREAAIKNAETAVVEKYSDEVRNAVTRLLEEEDPLLGDLGEPEVSEETQDVVDQAPPAHLAEEDEIVVIDLKNLGMTFEAEKELGEVSDDDTVSREEVMSNLETDMDVDMDIDMGAGMDTDTDITDDLPANRDDDEEIDINESELVDLFKEILAVDVSKGAIRQADESLTKDQLEIDEEEAVAMAPKHIDGMDKEDIEELKKAKEDLGSLNEKNEELIKTLIMAKNKLEEINLQNARLLYANRVLQDPSLNEQQKNKIAEMVEKAQSVEEAKLVFETLQKTMAGITRKAPKSLSEVITRSSSIILGGNRKQDQSTTDTNPVKNRWATIAGLRNK